MISQNTSFVVQKPLRCGCPRVFHISPPFSDVLQYQRGISKNNNAALKSLKDLEMGVRNWTSLLFFDKTFPQLRLELVEVTERPYDDDDLYNKDYIFFPSPMKFLCKTSDILQALQLVNRAISGQQALPILGNILFEVEGKRCTVSATDLELSIITNFEASVENEGSITIPAKAILNFAQYNSDPEVLLETSEGIQLKCTSKHSKTILSGEPATEYPTITPVEKENVFTLNPWPLLEALHLITFASAKSTLRPVLSGVFVHSEKGKLVLAATDSYRLSEYKLPTMDAGGDISCIIPVKVLEELRSILGMTKNVQKEGEMEAGKKKKETASKVEVMMSNQQIEIHVGQTKLLSRLIEGKFPDYEQIIPKGEMTTVTLPNKELTTAVKRMHYFAKEVNNNLTFKFSGGEAQITTPQTQFGKDEAMLSAEVDGKQTKIALSSSYLLDFLAHTDAPSIEIRVMDSLHPAIFAIPGSDQFLHLIMPLRMQEE